MNTSALRYISLILGIIFAGVLMAIPTQWLISNRGIAGPTLAESLQPVQGAVIMMICLVLTTILGCLVAKAVNALVGLFVVGCGLAVLSMQMGSISDFAFSNGSLWGLGFETLIWSLLILAITLVIFRTAGPLSDIQGEHPGDLFREIFCNASYLSASAGLVVLPAVWLIVRNTTKGQALAGVFLGCIAAGIVGRMLSPKVQPILLFATPVLAGAIAQLIAAGTFGGALEVSLIRGTLPVLLYPMPLDYAASSLMGVAFGLGWARSFIKEQEK